MSSYLQGGEEMTGLDDSGLFKIPIVGLDGFCSKVDVVISGKSLSRNPSLIVLHNKKTLEDTQ